MFESVCRKLNCSIAFFCFCLLPFRQTGVYLCPTSSPLTATQSASEAVLGLIVKAAMLFQLPSRKL
jgi:hypothetical protein